MKRGRNDANITSKFKPRIHFGDDGHQDDDILTCKTTTNCKTIKYNTISTTTTLYNHHQPTKTTTSQHQQHQRQQQGKLKRHSVQFDKQVIDSDEDEQFNDNSFSEYDKENYTSFSPLEKKTKTCHSILLCSPPASSDKFKSVLKGVNNTTPTRVLDFSDECQQHSLDDDDGHSTSTPHHHHHSNGTTYRSEDNPSGDDQTHNFILTPPSSTLSRASSRRISLTPPSTGRLSSGSDSIRRNLDFTLCNNSSMNDSLLLMDDNRHQHTLLSPFVSQFTISSPKSSMKKNRPTNIQLPKISPSKLIQDEDEEEESLDTPLISPLLLTSMDDVFGVEATRQDEETYKDFAEPSRRLARDLESDEDVSPSSINTNVHLRLSTIVHPKIPGCNAITSKTLLHALRDDDLKNHIRIIDCRFPHEFNGGHIRGANNIWTPDSLIEQFFPRNVQQDSTQIIIFHCEYSQARAPKMYRFMREYDRKIHLHEYPLLSFPDIYVLEGGYKGFWEEDEENKSFSEPRNYVAMDDERFVEDCKVSYQKCKTAWRSRKTQKTSFL